MLCDNLEGLVKGAEDFAGDSLVPLGTTGFFDSIQNVN